MELQNNLRKILKRGVLNSELDFQRASFIYRRLRLLVKKFPELSGDKEKLQTILLAYEDKHWVETEITEEKVDASDQAEIIADQENAFLLNRKIIIKSKLKEFGLTQKDLGIILNHTSVTYISELINGINPFTLNDIIVIHKLLDIGLEDLVPTTLTVQMLNKVVEGVSKLDNAKLKIRMKDLVTSG